ncbi:protein SHORT HYPOCOTYL IN WHITE LIGHT 1-like [Cucurbita maxima]|uniref:Protein SHORT HYPOCOTYL IN WHITE LIGHT 1-like n=1 Tax=Cucurbita maxima TaxID=3661 RepID=A0A6J1I8W5_CUCMA|nr:protein SHORT HYPOCOTYL IN WHITE LIGHT 1-like [Cucurbita maxima]XP_022972530.1 protein SHORT HYPOCOTYL IN WHITE LIGHT 1-like [Cucurbita maxima]
MSLLVARSPPSLFAVPQYQPPFPTSRTWLLSQPFQISHALLRASRRASNFSQGVDNPVDDRRNWNGSIGSDFDLIGGEEEEAEEEDEEDEDDEEDRSLDLLVQFVENVFRKVSRRARKAVRSVLPQSIPTKLVGFCVNGVLMLAFLWVLKAFLEVICTLGTAVFVSILIIRGVWTGILYLQDIRSHRFDQLDDDQPHAWTGAQPAS